MFTANTMSSAVEALGMALPGKIFTMYFRYSYNVPYYNLEL